MRTSKKRSRLTTVEIAPEQYHIECTYDDALLYCFQLNIDGKTGWRLPSVRDYLKNKGSEGHWEIEDVNMLLPITELTCIPVRDL